MRFGCAVRVLMSRPVVLLYTCRKALLPMLLVATGSAAFAATCTVTSTADTNTTGTLRYCVANAASGDTVDLSTLPALSVIKVGSSLLVPPGTTTFHGRTDGGVTISGGGTTGILSAGASSGTSTLNVDHLVFANAGGGQPAIQTGGSGTAVSVLNISNSTFVGNTGLAAIVDGASSTQQQIVTLTNVTFSQNSASLNIFKTNLTATNVTISGDASGVQASGGTVVFTKSIIAGNGTGTQCSGCTTDATDYTGSAPKLGALQLNGSLFQTMLPLVGSPVIGIAGTTTADQRGYAGKTAGDAGAVQTHYITVTAADTATGSGGDLNPADTTFGACSTTSTTAACTLRQAINYANTHSAIGTDITFAPALTATATTAAPAVITLGAALPNVASPIDLAGPGANLLQIAGAGAYRIATIAQTTGSLAFNGLTATRGAFSGGAGGAFLNQGTLTLEASSVTGSTANDGGGIFDDATSSILYLHNSTLSGNTATNGSGGGLYHEGVADVLLDSTISGNTASIHGGGAVIDSSGNANSAVAGVGRLVGVTISNNSVGNTFTSFGGGVFTYGSPTIANSVIEGNTGGPDPDLRGGYTDGGGNLINTSSSATNPGLGPLAYNGGTTQTLLPLPGSAAICTGTAANGLTYGTTNGQRGGTHSAAYCTAAQLDAGAVQTSYSAIQFVQQPSDVLVNAVDTPAPTVSVIENGTSAGGIPLTLTPTAGLPVSGMTATTVPGGAATFSALKFGSASASDHLAESLTITPSGYSPAYALSLYSNAFRVLATADTTATNITGLNQTPSPGQSNVISVSVADTTTPGATPVGTVSVVNTTTGTAVGSAAYSGTALTFDLASSTSGTNTFKVSFAPNAGAAYAASSLTFSVTVAAVPSAANSTLTASPATLPQGAVSTVTATLLDANKNPIANTAVTFNESSTLCTSGNGVTQCNTTNVMQSATTNMNGVAQVSLSAVQGANPVTVTATASGVTFNQVATVNFVAPAYVVTVATDTTTGVAANCVDPNVSATGNTSCSLRDAIAASNALNGVTTNITFAPALTATATTAAPVTITLNGTQLELSQSVTITGPGANLLQVSGNNASRVFQVDGGVTAGLQKLTITKGLAPASGIFSGVGGGLINDGTLTVTDAAVTLCVASIGSFLGGVGGGIAQDTGSLTVLRSTIFGNSAGAGGGISINSGSLTLVNSTVAGNTAPAGPGGGGGGVLLNSGNATTLTMTGSTVTQNTAAGSRTGGGMVLGGTSVINNSIVAGNTASLAPDIVGTYIGSGNVIGGTPMLSPLGYNGGTTQTLIPLPGSPALCAGLVSADGGVAQQAFTDQRGAVHSGAYCANTQLDAGAVQTSYALAFTTQPPATVTASTNFTVAVTLTEDALGFTGATESLPLTLNPAGVTLTGGTATTNATTGTATYTTLQVANPGTGDTLNANFVVTGTTAITTTSTAFTVTAAAPTITSISPIGGTQAGGTAVTITGTNLSTVTSVTFDGAVATFTYNNAAGTLTVDLARARRFRPGCGRGHQRRRHGHHDLHVPRAAYAVRNVQPNDHQHQRDLDRDVYDRQPLREYSFAHQYRLRGHAADRCVLHERLVRNYLPYRC